MRAAALSAVVGAALALAGCSSLQRLPAPMPLPKDAAPPRPAPAESTVDAVVVRHSDPVRVRRAGTSGASSLAFYRKRERLGAGDAVQCGAGGRAEVFWPGDASSVLATDETVLTLGEPSREEPLLTFDRITKVSLMLTPEDRVALEGGAELRGDPVFPSGPIVLDRLRYDLLRLTNQSLRPCTLHFLDGVVEVVAGDTVDVPILASGAEPFRPDPERSRIGAGGLDLELTGDADVAEESGAVRFAARQESRVTGLGLRVSLNPGGTVVFAPLSGRPSARAEPAPVVPPPDPAGTEPAPAAEEPEAGAQERAPESDSGRPADPDEDPAARSR